MPLNPLPENQAVTQVLASTAEGVLRINPLELEGWSTFGAIFGAISGRISLQLASRPELVFAQVRGAYARAARRSFGAAPILRRADADAQDADQRVPRITLESLDSCFVPEAVPADAPGGVSPARNERAQRFLNRGAGSIRSTRTAKGSRM